MRPLPVLVLLLCPACNQMLAEDDGRAFGDDMGRFQVDATLDRSSCGPGALDAPKEWDFEVVISRKDPVIYWNTGADATEGEIAGDGVHFTLSAEVSVVLEDPRDTGLGCIVARKDVIEGDLDSETDARSFEGTFEFRYAEKGDGDCTVALIEEGIESLPCSMSYAMTAERVSAR